MDSVDCSKFMKKRSVRDVSGGLSKICDHTSALASQLPSGFVEDDHKTRYLRRAVMRFDWAKQPIPVVTTPRYSFTQFLTALQESIQLNEEFARANAPYVKYGQYIYNSHDARHPNNPRQDPKHGYGPRRNYSRPPHGSRSQSPRRRSRSRLRIPYDPRRAYDYRHRQNPSLLKKQYCYGCGSPDHILSDRKCIPTPQSIRTNLVSIGEHHADVAEELAINFTTLFSSASQSTSAQKDEAP